MPRPPAHRLDPEPFRERWFALARNGETLADVARRAGYMRRRGNATLADTAPLKRALGLMNDTSSPPGRSRRTIGAKTAARLCEGLMLDPVEVGL